jgi:hypothetical protein
VGPRASLDELEKRETSCPCPIGTPDCPGRNLATGVNYLTRALNVFIKTPVRDFLATRAGSLIPSLLSDLIIESPWRRPRNCDELLFTRIATTVFPLICFTVLSSLRRVCADCIQGLLRRRQ